jgi:hypothetical protein
MTKPRLQISLDQRSLDVVRRLAASQKSPASRVVAELLTEATPMLEKMADTLEALSTAAKAHKERIRLTLADSEHEARTAAHIVVGMLDRIAAEAGAEAKGGAGANPRKPVAAARPPRSNRGATPPRSRPKPRPPRVSR